jgi:hypothetical protein
LRAARINSGWSAGASGSLARLPRTAIAALLALIVVAGFAWRAHHAASPYLALQSRDELAYVTLGQRLATRGIYEGGERWPLHWPPGAPAFFAAAYLLDHGAARGAPRPDIPSAYWAQALAGAALILVVFALAWVVAPAGRPCVGTASGNALRPPVSGPSVSGSGDRRTSDGAFAGLLAATAVAFYPPLVTMTADLLSEPAGTLALAVAVLAFVWALRGSTTRRYAVAGALLGVATLVRADFLFLPLVLALLVRRRGRVLALIGCAALVVVPWSAYISARSGHLTAVTTGDAPVLFIGTCLPCDGMLLGLKQTYGDEARLRNRALRGVPDTRLPASAVLDAIAARHPGRDRESALRREALSNVGYDLRHPIGYAGMELRKLRQLWLRPSRIGTSERIQAVVIVHVVLIVLAFAGLILGLVRARSPGLTAIALVLAYGTAVHLLTTADSRYNLPLVPLLFAGGAAGLFAARSRQGITAA